MNLSRKWLQEFVSVDANDKDFAESMTLSGSKVELTHDLGAEIDKIVAGRILSMEHHPDSDHMWVCHLDVGEPFPIQIVTGAWNIHVGDLVPVALDGASLPGGKKIEKGLLRGIESNGMMCGLYELGLDERDFPYAAITPAALLNDYHPLDPAKPSIPADIQPGTRCSGLWCAPRSKTLFPTKMVGQSHWISAADTLPRMIPTARTSTPVIWWPTTRTSRLSALWPTCGPSRPSSPTASPTASSSSTRRGWGPGTTSSR